VDLLEQMSGARIEELKASLIQAKQQQNQQFIEGVSPDDDAEVASRVRGTPRQNCNRNGALGHWKRLHRWHRSKPEWRTRNAC